MFQTYERAAVVAGVVVVVVVVVVELVEEVKVTIAPVNMVVSRSKILS